MPATFHGRSGCISVRHAPHPLTKVPTSIFCVKKSGLPDTSMSEVQSLLAGIVIQSVNGVSGLRRPLAEIPGETARQPCPRHTEIRDQRPQWIGEGRRTVLLDKEMADPGRSCPPTGAKHKPALTVAIAARSENERKAGPQIWIARVSGRMLAQIIGPEVI